MSIFKKTESYLGKLKHLDLKAKKESENNIKNPNKETELLALERFNVCKKCTHNELEPIENERVKDKFIPELSDRMCGVCFCPLPKLLRQNKKKCELKKW